MRADFEEQVMGKKTLACAYLVIALASLAVLSTPTWASDEYPDGKIKLFGKRHSIMLYVKYGGFLDDETKDTFGGNSLGISASLFRPETKSGFRWDVGPRIGYTKKSGESALTVGLLGGFRYNFSDPMRSSTVPFFKAHAGPVYVNTTGGNSALVLGANAALGMELNDRFIILVQYSFVDEVNGFDLSGWTAKLGIKVF